MSLFQKTSRQAEARKTTHSRIQGESLIRAKAAAEFGAQMAHERVNSGWLAELERRALRRLAERTPAWIEPDHLTGLGVAGAALVTIGFIGANVSPKFVAVVIFGLFINWYGDSLDGTLARYRGVERPRFGYFIDHSCDLISQTLIFLGLGLSPYFTLFSGMLALSMYMLMSSYTYLKVMIVRTHQLSYGGMGATELRVALGCWSIFGLWIGHRLKTIEIMGHFVLDEVIFGLWVMTFLIFIWMVISDQKKFRGLIDRQ